ncbi:MAG: alpha/beta hydrolase [Pseudomonadota bacterium]
MNDHTPLPIVLLPGLQSDHRAWHNQVTALGGDRSIIVPHGQQFCASIEEMAACVLAQLPPRFHLVAWSMGGYIAFRALTEIKDRMASLVLVGTSARPDTPEQTERRLALIEIAQREGILTAAHQSLGTSYHDHTALPALTKDHIFTAWLDIGAAAFALQQHAIIARPDTRERLSTIGVPTLIIVGEDDQVTPPFCAQELHSRIAESTLRIIPRCGHCPPLEQPDLVNGWLSDWWDQPAVLAG